MNAHFTQRAVEALAAAPLPVQKAFLKQLNFLIRDLRHPSLHAKQFDESLDIWQARINDDWRFYFTIQGDTYYIEHVRSHRSNGNFISTSPHALHSPHQQKQATDGDGRH